MKQGPNFGPNPYIGWILALFGWILALLAGFLHFWLDSCTFCRILVLLPGFLHFWLDSCTPIWAPIPMLGPNLGPNPYFGPQFGPQFNYGAPGALIYLFGLPRGPYLFILGPWGPQLFIYLWALRALVGP